VARGQIGAVSDIGVANTLTFDADPSIPPDIRFAGIAMRIELEGVAGPPGPAGAQGPLGPRGFPGSARAGGCPGAAGTSRTTGSRRSVRAGRSHWTRWSHGTCRSDRACRRTGCTGTRGTELLQRPRILDRRGRDHELSHGDGSDDAALSVRT
jgi:hypothetical protein